MKNDLSMIKPKINIVYLNGKDTLDNIMELSVSWSEYITVSRLIKMTNQTK
ncbi:hypothetical protein HanPI659440_Chr02g0085931 [Helianthus annuus]|nr:hypothetical protein HanPI659440_Chr02g0085931 [Helianthus annuus]